MKKLKDKNILVRNSNMKSKREPRIRVITLGIGLLEMRIKLVRVNNNKVERIWEKKTRELKIEMMDKKENIPTKKIQEVSSL